MSVSRAAMGGDGGHIDVGDLHCPLRPSLCLWLGQPPRALSGSMVLLQQGLGSWSVMTRDALWRTIIHALTDCCDVHDFRHIVEREEHGRLL